MKHLGLWDAEKNCGKLAGKEGNRVKAIRLRGELSQGICYPVVRSDDGTLVINIETALRPVCEGDDVAEVLGITRTQRKAQSFRSEI